MLSLLSVFSENLFVASESNCFLIIGGPFDAPKANEELISVGISMTDIITSFLKDDSFYSIKLGGFFV